MTVNITCDGMPVPAVRVAAASRHAVVLSGRWAACGAGAEVRGRVTVEGFEPSAEVVLGKFHGKRCCRSC